MTVNSSASTITLEGNGATNPFNFSFEGAPANATPSQAASYIQVTYTNSSGIAVILPSTTYTLSFNVGYLGGSVLYPTSGPPIANGTSIKISRIIPFTQPDSILNQGAFAPSVIEGALDNLELQIQQIATRGGAERGIWATGIQYNFGDIVQDGLNSLATFNLYTCAIPNTSGVWATDLASGNWGLALNVQTLQTAGSYLPLIGGTILGNLTIDGITTLGGGAIFPNNSIANVSLENMPAFTIKSNNTGGTGEVSDNQLSSVIDAGAGTFQGIVPAQGQVLYRNASAWIALPPGTSKQILQTQGTGANPQWTNPSNFDSLKSSISQTAVAITGSAVPATSAAFSNSQGSQIDSKTWTPPTSTCMAVVRFSGTLGTDSNTDDENCFGMFLNSGTNAVVTCYVSNYGPDCGSGTFTYIWTPGSTSSFVIAIRGGTTTGGAAHTNSLDGVALYGSTLSTGYTIEFIEP